MWDKTGDIKLPFAAQTTPKGTEGTNKSVLEMHGTFTIILLITVSLNEREREESFQVILMLLEFDNKTISDGHPLLKIRTIFVNLSGIQCYTFLIQGKTCHYLYPNLESWYHLAFVTPTIHPVSPSGHS